MLGKNLTRTEFIEYLEENAKNKDLPVVLTIKPTKGWKYRVIAEVTDIGCEPEEYDIAFISNAFSDTESIMTTNDIIARLKEIDSGYIAFEIYGCNGTTNEQIKSETPSINNIILEQSSTYTNIVVLVDKI